MSYYCGIDLGARHSHLCLVDDELSILVQERVPNELDDIIGLIRPYKEDLKVVVESTFNWYWLIDGLMEAGFEVCLAHTLGLYMITGAKIKTDRRDAFALAKLLRIKAIPEAYIYPRETRPVRDLLRRRSNLVNFRSAEYRSLRVFLLSHGILDHSRNSIKKVEDDDVALWLDHPLARLHARQELERIDLYSKQIRAIEEEVMVRVGDCRDYRHLTTIPGINVILGSTIYYETGDVHRFADARCYSSYCRLVPGIAQSGSSCRRGRGSKQGNPHLKWAFTQAATYAVRYYPKVRKSFDRHLKRHRGRARKLIAYNIIAHKLAQAAYHILRDGVEYKEELLFGA